MNAIEIIPGVYEDAESRDARIEEEMARPKYGSFIRDMEESVAARDWAQTERDLAALMRHHARVIAGKERLYTALCHLTQAVEEIAENSDVDSDMISNLVEAARSAAMREIARQLRVNRDGINPNPPPAALRGGIDP